MSFEAQTLTAVVGHQQALGKIKADCSAPWIDTFGTKEAKLARSILGESIPNCTKRKESLKVPGHQPAARLAPRPATWP